MRVFRGQTLQIRYFKDNSFVTKITPLFKLHFTKSENHVFSSREASELFILRSVMPTKQGDGILRLFQGFCLFLDINKFWLCFSPNENTIFTEKAKICRDRNEKNHERCKLLQLPFHISCHETFPPPFSHSTPSLFEVKISPAGSSKYTTTRTKVEQYY